MSCSRFQRASGWRAWSPTHKGQVLGAVAGAALTPAIYLIAIALNSLVASNQAQDAMLAMWLAMPLTAICRVFGLEGLLEIDPGSRPLLGLLVLGLYTITNSALLFALGTVAGWLVARLRGARKKPNI